MGWFLINILLPAWAPVLLVAGYLPFRKKLPPENRALVRFITPIKDGQLSWAGLAYCAAALYEMYEAKDSGAGLPEPWDGVLQVFFIITLVLNSMIAAGGAVFPVELPRKPTETIFSFYPAMLWSWALSGMSAAAFAVVHLYLS